MSVIVTVVPFALNVPGPLKLGVPESTPNKVLVLTTQQGAVELLSVPSLQPEELPLIPNARTDVPSKVAPGSKVVMSLAGFSKLGRSNVTSRRPGTVTWY